MHDKYTPTEMLSTMYQEITVHHLSHFCLLKIGFPLLIMYSITLNNSHVLRVYTKK